ncbi:hypothetical protein BDB01DRAFT_770279 [Pilobolus umbonatus]|nr:hypothetical protein BDB01DRAFT_770279 [Pilobolus umbonatus]
MPSSAKDARRLTGYRGDAHTENNHSNNNHNNNNHKNRNSSTGLQHQSLYDDTMKDYQQYQNTEDVYEEYDEDLDDSDSKNDDDHSDTGSELSIPNSAIDFDMVYALHTFGATVEGQASVVRGDALTLLDDSNSYWWLVKVLKTAEVGYIPAENIETPHERLARLNSHRNIQNTSKLHDFPPSNKPKSTKRVTLAKGVQFQSQIIYGSSDDEDDFESEFNLWHERMNSDDSDDSDSDSDDPYNYYENPHDVFDNSPHPADVYSPYTPPVNQHLQPPSGDTEGIMSTDSDIINDREEQIKYSQNNHSSDFEDETIKISLTPSIARGQDSNRGSSGSNRSSDTSIQTKLKKAAKLEKLLSGSTDQSDKKEKSGIRKFFSRGNSSAKEKDKKKKDKHSSTGSSVLETGSIDSQSIDIASIDNERMGSVDSEIQPSSVKLKLLPGNLDFGVPCKYVIVDSTTTAAEMIHDAIPDLIEDDHETAYQDYSIIVKTQSGDEFTLVPSDKPFEIYESLTAHLNTPMPSLKKARRISQMMMGNDDTHMGGPKDNQPMEENVQFYMHYKPRRMDEGEIQIKVSLLSSDSSRLDKLVKVSASLLVRDAIGLLLEKFHILNGLVDDITTLEEIDSLRLKAQNDIVKYQLVVCRNREEHVLSLDDRLVGAFGDDIPYIYYRRNSNPDRSSITANIPPPEADETHFILRSTEEPKQEEEEEKEKVEDTKQEEHFVPKRVVRQNTPMPRGGVTPTEGFQPVPQYQPQIVIDPHDMMHSPEQMTGDHTSDANEDEDSATNDQPDMPVQKEMVPSSPPPPPPSHQKRRQSTESMLFCNDFGMNDLMVLIRGAARKEANVPKQGRHNSYHIRSEILDVFKDHQSRLDQLEKELDRIMTESVRVYQ